VGVSVCVGAAWQPYLFIFFVFSGEYLLNAESFDSLQFSICFSNVSIVECEA